MTRRDVNRYADTSGEELLVADGFDACIVGIAQQFNKSFVVYDRAKVIKTLMTRDGMTKTDAEEFFEFNVVGAFVGEHTPAFLVRDIS